MFWIDLIAVALMYSLTRNVFWSICLGFLASIALVPHPQLEIGC
jgi:hypothetical protein